MCSFFAGSVGEWAGVVVTLLVGVASTLVTLFTGVAVAIFAYQANRATAAAKKEAHEDMQRRARTYAYSISVEVGSAQSFLFNIRRGLAEEADLGPLASIETFRRLQASLDIDFLPTVRRDYASAHYLPEACTVYLLSGLASIDNARRSLKITLDSPVNVDDQAALTPAGWKNVHGVADLLAGAEVRFRNAHRALWSFVYPGQPLTEWQYPEGANIPRALRA